MSHPIDIITEKLSRGELLNQLAEEGSEMVQAALKLRRAEEGTNPTPKSAEECRVKLEEEIGDVSACLIALGYDRSLARMRVSVGVQEKLERWAARLEGREDA